MPKLTKCRLVAAMPLAALFILFESTVYDPINSESKNNLFFLDMAAGYFSRLEYDSGGSVHGSIFSEFTFLARKFIHEEQNTNRSVGPEVTIEGTDSGPSQNVPVEMNGASSQVTSADIVRILTFNDNRNLTTEANLCAILAVRGSIPTVQW